MNELTDEPTVSELRELLTELHPRKPAEVMGQAATSSLIGSTVTAAVGWTGVLLLATVVIFMFGGGPIQKRQAVAAPTVDSPGPDSPGDESQSSEGAPSEAVSAAEPTANDDAVESAVNAMGIGETKAADENANPLENRLDQLLDGLE